MDNITCLIGDNCSTNQSLARLCGVPLVGCASHRLNLAVNMWFTQYEPLLIKINLVQAKVRGSLVLSRELSKHTDLRTELRNKTRSVCTYYV